MLRQLVTFQAELNLRVTQSPQRTVLFQQGQTRALLSGVGGSIWLYKAALNLIHLLKVSSSLTIYPFLYILWYAILIQAQSEVSRCQHGFSPGGKMADSMSAPAANNNLIVASG